MFPRIYTCQRSVQNLTFVLSSSVKLRKLEMMIVLIMCMGVNQGRTNLWRQVAGATKFCSVAPSICGSCVWNLLLDTLEFRGGA